MLLKLVREQAFQYKKIATKIQMNPIPLRHGTLILWAENVPCFFYNYISGVKLNISKYVNVKDLTLRLIRKKNC